MSEQTKPRRRWLRWGLTVLGVLVAVPLLLLATVSINAEVLERQDLAEQAARIETMREAVADPDWEETPIPDETAWTDTQAIASHNSYAIAPNAIQDAAMRLVRPGEAEKLAYTHPPLWEQFDQGIRSVELDLRLHKNGEVRLTHVPLIANGSNSPDFLLALEEVALWSGIHPGHLPITLLLEFKMTGGLDSLLDSSLAEWTPAALERLDRTISDQLGTALLTPADIDGDRWPTVGELRSRVVVFMHPGEKIEELYAEVPQSDRVMFVGQDPGRDSGFEGPVFVVHNNPDSGAISALVDEGALVRTRADSDMDTEVIVRDQALSTRAQIISSDFVFPTTRADLDYTVVFPDGTLNRITPN